MRFEHECEDHGAFLSFRVTDAVASALFDIRIFRGMSLPMRAEPERVLFPRDGKVEPYSAFLMRGPLASMGAFSYAHTALPWDIRVGRYCSIARGLQIFGEQHPTDRATTSVWSYDKRNPVVSLILRDLGIEDFATVPAPQKPAPVIGNDVWIGAEATLARGITIGDGAIIGAHAVVTRSVEPFCVVGGNPARVIRRRFQDDLCETYLRVRWWDYALAAMQRPSFTDPRRFIGDIEELAGRRLLPYAPQPLDAAGLSDLLRRVGDGTWTAPALVTMGDLLGRVPLSA